MFLLLFDLAVNTNCLLCAVIGAAIGGLAVYFSRYVFPDTNCPVADVTEDTVSNYQDFKKKYLNKKSDNDPEGFAVSIEQWMSINKTIADLGGNLNDYGGFRLTFGINYSGEHVSMAQPLRETSNPNQPYVTENMGHVNTVKLRNSIFCIPCPHFCD